MVRAIIGLFSIPTVAVLVGAALTVWGLHMVYPPAAYIVPGVLLMLSGLFLALPARPRGD